MLTYESFYLCSSIGSIHQKEFNMRYYTLLPTQTIMPIIA
jgi:hypothetical protein